jgi:hypothetical protein
MVYRDKLQELCSVEPVCMVILTLYPRLSSSAVYQVSKLFMGCLEEEAGDLSVQSARVNVTTD